jgi:hypothetical protein
MSTLAREGSNGPDCPGRLGSDRPTMRDLGRRYGSCGPLACDPVATDTSNNRSSGEIEPVGEEAVLAASPPTAAAANCTRTGAGSRVSSLDPSRAAAACRPVTTSPGGRVGPGDRPQPRYRRLVGVPDPSPGSTACAPPLSVRMLASLMVRMVRV